MVYQTAAAAPADEAVVVAAVLVVAVAPAVEDEVAAVRDPVAAAVHVPAAGAAAFFVRRPDASAPAPAVAVDVPARLAAGVVHQPSADRDVGGLAAVAALGVGALDPLVSACSRVLAGASAPVAGCRLVVGSLDGLTPDDHC